MKVEPFIFCAWKSQYTQVPFQGNALPARLQVILATSWYWEPDAYAMNISIIISFCSLNAQLESICHISFIWNETGSCAPGPDTQQIEMISSASLFHMHPYELLLKLMETVCSLEAVWTKELRWVAEIID